MKAKCCIHAVGPQFGQPEKWPSQEAQLTSAYAESLKLASQYGIATIGFALLSSSIFRGGKTLESIAAIALKSVAENVYPGLQVCARVWSCSHEFDVPMTGGSHGGIHLRRSRNPD